jgi:penicillin-binding protein 2
MGAIAAIPRTDPVPGHDLTLTIDSRLQIKAQQAFPDSLKGAVVAIDPRTGEVLIMLSHPTVDPNIFSASASLRSKRWAAIATDPALPLNCRATAGTYSPGSTFKLIPAVAGLASGKMTAASTMPRPCVGALRIGRRIAHCWELKGHGYLNLIRAVQASCDVYFYQVGMLLGDKLINQYAALFGLGEKMGIDFPVEKSGWLSGEDAYNERFKDRGWTWTGGLVCDLAIGQAQIATPLQLAGMVGAFGKGQVLYRPFLLKEERTEDGKIISTTKPGIIRQIDLSPQVLSTMHEAMAAVMEAGGTGGYARVPGVNVGGKTGSAQNPQGEKTHALFIGCAPLEDQVIAIAVVVENAGHGGSIAAPIAGEIMRYYFKDILHLPKDTTKQDSTRIN